MSNGATLTQVYVAFAVLFHEVQRRISPAIGEDPMADVIYLVAGVAIFLVFAGYALLLRRA